MKIGIYLPQFNLLNQADCQLLLIAEYLLQKNWAVELFWPEGQTLANAIDKFGLNLKQLTLNEKMYYSLDENASYILKWHRIKNLRSYDLILMLSEGRIPYLNSRQNWIFFNKPVQTDGRGFFTQQMLTHIHRIISNSSLTKKWVDSSFGIKSDVIYTLISVSKYRDNRMIKTNSILLSVNLDKLPSYLPIETLVEGFKILHNQNKTSWELVLLLDIIEQNDNLLKLEKSCMNYAIKIIKNTGFPTRVEWFKKAKIIWSAAGLGKEQSDWFDYSILEGMAAGCIPIVFNGKINQEIIKNKVNGYLWEDENQLKQITLGVIDNINKGQQLIKENLEYLKKFSQNKFFENLGLL